MKPADPVIVVHLFPVLLKKLLELLTSLGPEEWQKPTPCPAWSVHDVALHLLGVDMGELSRGRDKFETSYIQAHGWDELVTSLNRQNERWVIATRGISPFLLTETLGFTGEQACLHFSSLDPSSTGPTVSWAGSGPAPMWLHVAREYTERWHHQQQIREATGRPLLTNPEMFAPVLATFVRALPRAFFQVPAAEGSIVRLIIEGESGGNWCLVLRRSEWVLYGDDIEACPAAQIIISQENAWKLFTKSIPKQEVQLGIKLSGDAELGSKILDTVSVIA